MSYYKQFWQVYNGEEKVNAFFVTKKSAVDWIAEQADPTPYTIKKVSME
jgi:hypothetical protein